VFDNIHAAFDNHRRSIAELTKKQWKFAGSDIGSWVVVGSLAGAAAGTGSAALGFAALVAEKLLDPPKLKEIPKSFRELADESRKIKFSPVGLLFKYAKSK
jgi:hypothetical protein